MPKSHLQQIQLGIQCFYDGARDARTPALRRFIWMPICLNIIIFSVLLYFGIQYLLNKIHFLSLINLPDWLSWLNWILKPLEYIIVGIFFIFAFTSIALISTMTSNILGAPFNGLLSERALKMLQIPIVEQSWGTSLRRSTGRELRKLTYFILRWVGVLLLCAMLYFIPLVNLFIPVLFFLMGAWTLAIEYIDYAADNVGVGFKPMIAQLKTQRWMFWGFGLIVMFVSSIPVLNFVVMPVAVLGGTRLWSQLNSNLDKEIREEDHQNADRSHVPNTILE